MIAAPSLRPYQQVLADEVRTAYRAGYKCPLVVASTGAGKTVLFSYITHGASQKGNPVLIAAHRKEIIRQISLSLARFGVEHQVIAPPDKVRQIKVAHFRAFGRSFVSPSALTMVGSVQTIVGRLETIDKTVEAARARSATPIRLMVVMDEGHHVVADTQWGRVMDHCARHDALGLKVTASPGRLDGTGLGKGHGGYADTMIEAPPMSWLIEQGFLSPYRVFTVPKPIDMTGAAKRAGDWAVADLNERADKPGITGDAIQHWRRHANDMRTVVFCVSVEHSKHVAEQFNAAGIPAAHIDGTTEDAERDGAIMDFADGRVLVLTQVNLISEGFDLSSIAQKDVTIDCLVDLAPTESLVNAMQRWGRVLRPAAGKTAIILDHAGNVLTHGLPDMPREWSLEGKKKGRRAANDNLPDVPVVTCTKCFAIHAPAPACVVCGFVYPIKERKIEHRDGELAELTPEAMDAMRRAQRVLQGKQQTVEDLVRAAGMSRGRAEKIVAARAEKQALIDGILADLAALQADTGGNVWAHFSVSVSAVRNMKPKQLKELAARVGAEIPGRQELTVRVA